MRRAIEPSEERRAIEAILEREFAWLRRVCILLASEEDFGVDCLQDVLFQVARSLPSFRETSRLRTWMFVICRRVVKRRKFRRWIWERREVSGEERDISGLPSSSPLEPSKSQASVEDLLGEREVYQRLWRHVETLPEMQRLSVVLYYGEEMSISEVSQALGCSESSVKTHLSRARERLRQSFQLE